MAAVIGLSIWRAGDVRGSLARPILDKPSVLPGGPFVRMAIGFVLLSVTVLEGLGISVGYTGLKTATIAVYLLLAIAGLSGVLAISVGRLVLCSACLVTACVSYWLNARFAHTPRLSEGSLFLLFVTFLPFIFVLHMDTVGHSANQSVLEGFLKIAWLCALAGIVQFYAQFFIHGSWLFNYRELIPPIVRGPSSWNTVIQVSSKYNKSNGFFFREPSLFSFAMALALLIEGSYRRRLSRMVSFGFALLLSYSGTGIFTLLVGMLFPFGRRTLVRLIGLACAGAVVLWLLGDALNLWFTVHRVTEFGSERSSAYIRYIAPFRLLGETWNVEPWTLWLGHGPGAMTREIRDYLSHDPTFAKLLFEYGVLGFVLFVLLFLMVLRRSAVAIRVRAALFFSWLLMGGNLLSPEHSALTLILVGFLPIIRHGVSAPAGPASPHQHVS